MNSCYAYDGHRIYLTQVALSDFVESNYGMLRIAQINNTQRSLTLFRNIRSFASNFSRDL